MSRMGRQAARGCPQDHYHGWSGFGCMAETDGSCKTGIAGAAIGAQFILILMVILWSGVLSSLVFLVLKLFESLRISEEVEAVGMDEHHHSPPKAYAIKWEARSLPTFAWGLLPKAKEHLGMHSVAVFMVAVCAYIVRMSWLLVSGKERYSNSRADDLYRCFPYDRGSGALATRKIRRALVGYGFPLALLKAWVLRDFDSGWSLRISPIEQMPQNGILKSYGQILFFHFLFTEKGFYGVSSERVVPVCWKHTASAMSTFHFGWHCLWIEDTSEMIDNRCRLGERNVQTFKGHSVLLGMITRCLKFWLQLDNPEMMHERSFKLMANPFSSSFLECKMSNAERYLGSFWIALISWMQWVALEWVGPGAPVVACNFHGF